MILYAVIDTNVLVSALLKKDSLPGRIVSEALIGAIIPVFDEEIFSEYESVLNRPAFRFDMEEVGRLLRDLRKRAVLVKYGSIEYELPDPQDAVFYAVLMEKRKENDVYLVTGNLRHFPDRPYIVTPREMMDIIEKLNDTN
ncbi:MAG: putative toxin-antitoxin system toxin component, PIN family [Lachnospiraceae bacterium]|nr:putative toxin-antitoxin system toxin component, PIN family [Lachnospiraceae bacterium]